LKWSLLFFCLNNSSNSLFFIFERLNPKNKAYMNNKPDQLCGEAVFRQVFFDYAESVRNFLYYKSGDLLLAEDLTQEAFLRLWTNCKKVSYEKARSFLFTVANNLFLDAVKHRKVVKRFQLNWTASPNELTPEDAVEAEELKKLLEKALMELTEKQRLVFLLNRIEKMTYAEIAELLDIGVKAVEKRMHKALLRLREIVEQYGREKNN